MVSLLRGILGMAVGSFSSCPSSPSPTLSEWSTEAKGRLRLARRERSFVLTNGEGGRDLLKLLLFNHARLCSYIVTSILTAQALTAWFFATGHASDVATAASASASRTSHGSNRPDDGDGHGDGGHGDDGKEEIVLDLDSRLSGSSGSFFSAPSASSSSSSWLSPLGLICESNARDAVYF